MTVDTIVSEHYDKRDPNAARLMERFYDGNIGVGCAGSTGKRLVPCLPILLRDVPMYGSESIQVAGTRANGLSIVECEQIFGWRMEIAPLKLAVFDRIER